MSVTTPTTGQKISDFSAGIVDANSYFIQARNGGTSKVSAPQIGQFSNLKLLFTGDGGLNTTAKTIVGAINEIKTQEESDIADVQAAIDELDGKTGSDIAISDSSSEPIAEVINGLSYEDGESGTLATGLWKYRKWADGTLEVWAHQRTTETLTFSQWGGVYVCDPIAKINGSSPIAFVSTDFVSGSLFINSLNGFGTLRTDQTNYIYVRGAIAADGDYSTDKYKYQRGRWKA